MEQIRPDDGAGNGFRRETTIRWWLGRISHLVAFCLPWGVGIAGAIAQPAEEKSTDPLRTGVFEWRASAPLVGVGAGARAVDRHLSIKDPTIVFFDGFWHLFTTVRMDSGAVDIAFLRFADWSEAGRTERHLLELHDQYYCAPEVFYFSPHRLWYLIYQLADKGGDPPFGPYYSTSREVSDPNSWSAPRPMITGVGEGQRWLDFWVICDAQKAHLFYTSLDGRMWRRETPKSKFPTGWSEATLAIEGDIFEASHTYRLRGRNQYLTIVEAQGDRRRYYKAYLADRLEGPWNELAASRRRPFAAYENVRQNPEWTRNISHGELIRSGVDELLEVDPRHLRFLFQGATDQEYRNSGGYGRIPWRLGMLELVD